MHSCSMTRSLGRVFSRFISKKYYQDFDNITQDFSKTWQNFNDTGHNFDSTMLDSDNIKQLLRVSEKFQEHKNFDITREDSHNI